MRKLRLDFEELKVESFATGDGDDTLRGTVRGNSGSIYQTGINATCPATGGCGSCYNSCVPGACGSGNQTFVEMLITTNAVTAASASMVGRVWRSLSRAAV